MLFLWTFLQLLVVVVDNDQLYIKVSTETWLRTKLSEKRSPFQWGETDSYRHMNVK